jgi:hypothetical protein
MSDVRPASGLPRVNQQAATDVAGSGAPVSSPSAAVSGQRVLGPSCGCGLLDALRDAGAEAFGIEVDGARGGQCREKGHRVCCANFLETVPTGNYDRVVMNPPSYGTQYARHVEHALRYLRPGGILTDPGKTCPSARSATAAPT